jgi:hypothetical protein
VKQALRDAYDWFVAAGQVENVAAVQRVAETEKV